MMPQFSSRWNLVKRYENIARGLFIFSIGLFKKVIIADSFAEIADAGFKGELLSSAEAWITSLSYTFQLYFDFSGYTDMAIGAALLFNIKIPINFNSPYKALSLQDFWHRWHITLSRFLRDYIYIPLGGNRCGDIKKYTNLIATFLLGGIWHGAGWTFVFWGLLHGIGLVVDSIWKGMNIKLPKFIAWFITFNFLNITWIFFRAEDFNIALNILSSMFFINQVESIIHLAMHPDWFIMAFIVVLYTKTTAELSITVIHKKKMALFSALLFVSSMLMVNHVSKFLYYDF